jgi:hypothetical protein
MDWQRRTMLEGRGQVDAYKGKSKEGEQLTPNTLNKNTDENHEKAAAVVVGIRPTLSIHSAHGLWSFSRRASRSVISINAKSAACGFCRPSMSNDNVIPFRKRPPSESELEIYRQITRNWHPDMRRLMFPEHFERDQRQDERKG